MSRTFTLSDTSSVLSADLYPPIELDKNARYGLGLLGFYSYNSIINVDETNNVIGFKVKGSTPTHINIPPGAYEVEEINNAIRKYLLTKGTLNATLLDVGPITEENIDKVFNLQANNNTLKCEIMSKFAIDFRPKNSLAGLLGFQRKIFEPHKTHESTLPVAIIKVRIIRIDCNITGGAYANGQEGHTLFELDVNVEPGYQITKEPRNIIYMPITPVGRQFIDNITISVLDDNCELVDFRGEKIIVKLELKKLE